MTSLLVCCIPDARLQDMESWQKWQKIVCCGVVGTTEVDRYNIIDINRLEQISIVTYYTKVQYATKSYAFGNLQIAQLSLTNRATAKF